MSDKPTIRSRVCDLVHVSENQTKFGRAYDYVMIAAIVVSLVPLCFKEEYPVFRITDLVVTVLFIVDYLLRWSTADIALGKGRKSFAIYPFMPMAIIDLLSILPFFLPMNQGFKALRLLRMVRALRAIRFIRESRSFRVIGNVLRRERALLLSVEEGSHRTWRPDTLPAGIVIGGYMDEMCREMKDSASSLKK